jgi:O-antigen/teichoic acid export membrane protein
MSTGFIKNKFWSIILIKLKEMFKSRFVKNITLVASGTAFAQLLSILLSPIITRIYSPEEYGILSVFVSLLSLLSVGATLNYHRAIPLAENDKKSFNVIALSFIILSLFTGIISAVLLFKGEGLINLLNSTTLLNYMFVIPVGVFFLGVYNILLHWSLRIKDFKTLTRTKVTQSVAANLSKIAFGLFGFGSAGLLIGQIIGQSGGICRLSKPLLAQKKEFMKSIDIKQIKIIAKRYVKFPIYTTPGGYVYTAGNQAPIIILSLTFGTSVVGFYGLANSIVNLPISLLATSVSQVFYSEAARIGKENLRKIRTLSIKLSLKLALIGLIPLMVFVLLGPWLFSSVFGATWYDAGVYAQVLSIGAYTHFVILPITRVLEILEKQQIALIINVFRLIAIISAFFISSFSDFTPLLTMVMYVTVSSLSYLILFIAVLIIITKETRIVEKIDQ